VVRRALLRCNHAAGVALGAGAELDATDLTVRGDSCPEDDGAAHRGLEANRGAAATVTRALFDQVREVAIAAFGDGTTVTLSDLEVRGTTSSLVFEGQLGRGLFVQSGAEATLERALFDANREVSLAAMLPGARVDGTDIVIRGTLEVPCEASPCPGGIGAGAYGGGHVSLRRFEVEDNDLAGVQLGRGREGDVLCPEGGTMDLAEGVVRRNLVGANVQTEGFELDRLVDDVAYYDNEINLDAETRPTPSVVLPRTE
jgi:hypothetical protein